GFICGYIDSRSDLKPSTRVKAQADADSIIAHFGDERLLRDVLPADADSYLAALLGRQPKLAKATIGRRIVRCRQFFRAAVRHQFITENPFADIRPPIQTNRDRIRFVTADETTQILEACPDLQWR